MKAGDVTSDDVQRARDSCSISRVYALGLRRTVFSVYKENRMTEHPVSFRLDSETVARLDALAEALTARAAGATVNRSSVLRLAVERGVRALEAELGRSKKRKR